MQKTIIAISGLLGAVVMADFYAVPFIGDSIPIYHAKKANVTADQKSKRVNVMR